MTRVLGSAPYTVEDDIHGYAFANTHYGNYLSGFDPAQYAKNQDMNPDELLSVSEMAYARYQNYVGSVLGTAGKQMAYQCEMSSPTDPTFWTFPKRTTAPWPAIGPDVEGGGHGRHDAASRTLERRSSPFQVITMMVTTTGCALEAM